MSPLVELRDQAARDRMGSYVTHGSLNGLDLLSDQSYPSRTGVMQDSAEKALWGRLLQPARRATENSNHPFIL